MRSASDASKTSVKCYGRARVGLSPHLRSLGGLRWRAAVPLGAAIAPRPLVRVPQRDAPIAVPAVIMMHIAARTPGSVTSRQRDCRCLTGQKSLCSDYLDRIASIGPETQLDAAKVIVGVSKVRHRAPREYCRSPLWSHHNASAVSSATVIRASGIIGWPLQWGSDKTVGYRDARRCSRERLPLIYPCDKGCHSRASILCRV